MFPFARASKFCYKLAISTLYRTITLTIASPNILEKTVAAKLLSPNHDISNYNRHLIVRNIKVFSSLYDEQLVVNKLLAIVQNVKQVDSFRYYFEDCYRLG